MSHVHRGCGFGLAVISMLTLTMSSEAAELAADGAVRLLADRLEQSQVHDWPDLGLWPGEEMFTGPTVAGMACAYEWTKQAGYQNTAQAGANYILSNATLDGTLLGDEAYALVRMSRIRREADATWVTDAWRDAIVRFYNDLRDPNYCGSTRTYIQYFDDLDPSTNVFFFAHHVMAAYYIDDPDKDVWRDALIRHLSHVDDESSFPVMALGAATWALAEVGGLDKAPVASSDGRACWDGVLLSDLPGLLRSHQVPAGEPHAGSFYWRLDHTSGGTESLAAGYTEDAVYGTLGLAAAALANPDLRSDDVNRAIASAQDAILQGVDAQGKVYEHLTQQGETYHVYAGEMLQALSSVKQCLDLRKE